MGRNPEHTAAVPRKGPEEGGIPVRLRKWHLGLEPKAFLFRKMQTLPAMQESPTRFLGQEDLLEKG